jgi:hypothetical protein
MKHTLIKLLRTAHIVWDKIYPAQAGLMIFFCRRLTAKEKTL